MGYFEERQKKAQGLSKKGDERGHLAHNSTIVQREKICVRCGKPKILFSKGRCPECAKIEDANERARLIIKRDIVTLGLSELIAAADDVFSKYVRAKGADENGIACCYTCGKPARWQELQCGHYIGRDITLYLRWDVRNCRIQCKTCNEFNSGNIAVFTQKLEEDYPGITEILTEESMVVYKPGRTDIQGVIDSYYHLLKAELKRLPK